MIILFMHFHGFLRRSALLVIVTFKAVWHLEHLGQMFEVLKRLPHIGHKKSSLAIAFALLKYVKTL